MDQGPVKPPPRPRWTGRDVLELAKAVGVMWIVAGLLTATIVVIWSGVRDLSVRDTLTPSAVIVAALQPMFGILSRAIDASTKGWTDSATVGRQNAFFGDQEAAGLTTVGVFLFVSIPLALLGTLLGG